MILKDIHIVWNPEADAFDPPRQQIEDLRRQISSAGIRADLRLEDRSSRDHGHFHDRVLHLKTIDDLPPLRLRIDVTSGIDNLMSVQKECSLFVEIL